MRIENFATVLYCMYQGTVVLTAVILDSIGDLSSFICKISGTKQHANIIRELFIHMFAFFFSIRKILRISQKISKILGTDSRKTNCDYVTNTSFRICHITYEILLLLPAQKRKTHRKQNLHWAAPWAAHWAAHWALGPNEMTSHPYVLIGFLHSTRENVMLFASLDRWSTNTCA